MKSFYFLSACFISFLTTIYGVGHAKPACLEKEKALTMLETAEDLLTQAEDSFPSCDESITTDESECGRKKPLAYIEIAKKLISDVKNNFPKCEKPIVIKYEHPRDCSELLANGYTESDFYKIWAGRNETEDPMYAYCDMDTDGGGWTVIQTRFDSYYPENFYQDWEAYKVGFGNYTEEYWLGNENIYSLCNEECEIRFDLQDKKGEKRYAHYRNFKLYEDYSILIVDYQGNAGDSMRSHNLGKFSTKDAGDTFRANIFYTGWWMGEGVYSNLNGIYQPGVSSKQSVFWWEWRGYEGLAHVQIKVRPK